MNKIPELRKKVLDQASSQKLGQYVWRYGAGPQMGYSFSLIHALAYSFIGVQTLFIATNWNPIYWDCACLIVNSGSLQDNSEEELVDIYEPEGDDLANGITFEDLPDRSAKIRRTASTDYGKIAKAIGEMMAAGIKISLVDINKSDFSFKPDVKNNQILFGMKGLLNVGDEVVTDIINNRPYTSPRDFINKVNPKKTTMISLIKAGAFDNMIPDRKVCLGWYLWEVCDKKSRLTLQNMPSLMKYNLVPEDTEDMILARRIYEFNRYLKAITKINPRKINGYFIIDERAIDFLQEINYDDLIEQQDNLWIVNTKSWDKIYQKTMDIFRNWITENKDNLLNELNSLIFKEEWDKYTKKKNNISAWEMEVMCFYYHDHELKNLDNYKYGFSNFFDLPEEPEVERSFIKGNKTINISKLSKICGTCIAKNKTKSTVSLLTTTGVVNVKFRKEYFALFDKQISEKGVDGKKHIVEKSWFNRGSMIVVQGVRSGNNFIAKKYASTGGHQLYKISEVFDDGTISLQTERYQGGIEEENEEE